MVEVVVTTLALLVALVVLMETSKKATEHSIKLARALGVGEMAIGFILVAVATSLPELTISITSALSKRLDLSFGNVFGANISNLLLVIGIVAVVGAGKLGLQETKRLAVVLLGVVLISLPLLLFEPGRATGLILLLVFPMYSLYLLGQRGGTTGVRNLQRLIPETTFFLVFVATVILSAKITVDFALQLSSTLGIAEAVLGATIISIGTTLPELSVSLAAARANHLNLAIGNAVGSCLVNISLVLGTGLFIYPFFTMAPAVKLVLLSIIANALVLFMMTVVKKLEKREGVILIAAYFAFLAYLLIW